jgi:hypothetical protein
MKRVLDRFDEALCVAGGDSPTGRSVFESLMVSGYNSEGLYSDELSEFRREFDKDVVDRAVSVRLAARPILGEMLEDGGSFSDTEELHPIADAEHWDASVDREARELKVEVLLGPRGADGRGVRRPAAEALGVEVITS